MATPVEYELNLRDYWRIFRRHQWSILALTALFGVLAFAFAQINRPVPIYQATAVVKWEKNVTMTGFMVESMGLSPGDNMRSQAAEVRSFPVLERAAKSLQLIAPELDADAISRNPKTAEILADLRERVSAAPEEHTNLLDISAIAPTGDQAAKLANAVAQAYRAENRLAINARIIEARRFIETQVNDVGGQLAKAEEALRLQKQKYGLVSLPEQTAAIIGRSASLRLEYERLRAEHVDLAKQVDILKAAPAGTLLLRPGVEGNDGTIAKLNGLLMDYLIEKENLLVNATREHPGVRELEAKIARVQKSIEERNGVLRDNLLRDLAAKQQVLGARIAEIQTQVGATDRLEKTLPDVAREFAQLGREVAINENLLGQLRTRLQEVRIKEQEQIEEVKPVRPAQAGPRPINPPQVAGKVLAGLLIGLLVGLTLAFILESLDTSIATVHDVEQTLSTHVLGMIPTAELSEDPALEAALAASPSSQGGRTNLSLLTLLAPRCRIAEAYRFLRTNLDCVALDREVKTIALTSATVMEGKTTTAVNLAITMAQSGKRTLLIEADLRKPYIHRVFGLGKTPGLTEVLLGHKPWDECVRGIADFMLGPLGIDRLLAMPDIDNLHVLPSGAPVPNPSEFLASRAMTELIATLREQFDCLIFDCPPILPVTDAALLASKVDGVVMVYRVGRISRVALKRAKDLLENVKGTVLGLVLTGIKPDLPGEYEQLAYAAYADGAKEPEAEPLAAAAPRSGIWASLKRAAGHGNGTHARH